MFPMDLNDPDLPRVLVAQMGKAQYLEGRVTFAIGLRNSATRIEMDQGIKMPFDDIGRLVVGAQIGYIAECWRAQEMTNDNPQLSEIAAQSEPRALPKGYRKSRNWIDVYSNMERGYGGFACRLDAIKFLVPFQQQRSDVLELLGYPMEENLNLGKELYRQFCKVFEAMAEQAPALYEVIHQRVGNVMGFFEDRGFAQ